MAILQILLLPAGALFYAFVTLISLAMLRHGPGSLALGFVALGLGAIAALIGYWSMVRGQQHGFRRLLAFILCTALVQVGAASVLGQTFLALNNPALGFGISGAVGALVLVLALFMKRFTRTNEHGQKSLRPATHLMAAPFALMGLLPAGALIYYKGGEIVRTALGARIEIFDIKDELIRKNGDVLGLKVSFKARFPLGGKYAMSDYNTAPNIKFLNPKDEALMRYGFGIGGSYDVETIAKFIGDPGLTYETNTYERGRTYEFYQYHLPSYILRYSSSEICISISDPPEVFETFVGAPRRIKMDFSFEPMMVSHTSANVLDLQEIHRNWRKLVPNYCKRR